MIVANTVYSERTTTNFNRYNNQQNSSENVHVVAVHKDGWMGVVLMGLIVSDFDPIDPPY